MHKVCPRCATRFDEAATFCQLDGQPLVAEAGERDPYIGRVILDQFRIEEAIGAGGMGTVYRARQTTLDRDVAIKILHPDLIRNPDAVRRFQREAKVSTALDHPNVVRVSLFGQLPDGNLYLVMELLRGRSLAAMLEAEAPLEVPRALHIARQICDAIGDAHVQGVVHRDVKPENVLLVRRGDDIDFVKVLDFGIARLLHGENTVLTQSGLVFGTARYISPEAASGEPTDARSDVYSIATVLYQMLTGDTPFQGTPVALLMKHIHDRVPPLRSGPRGAQIPPAVEEMVMRALSKNPALRQINAHALGEAIDEAALRSGLALPARRMSQVGTYGPADTTPRMPGRTSNAESFVRSAPSLRTRVPDEDFEIAGLPRKRSGPGALTTLLLAFFLGATSVAGGAALVAYLLRPAPHEVATADAGPVVPAPLPEAPAPAPAPPVVELSSLPASPSTSEAVTLLAQANAALPADVRASFLVRREGSAVIEVPASSDASHTRFFAAQTFTRAGAYEVEFRAGDTRATVAIAVRAAPRPPVHVAQPETPPQEPQEPPPISTPTLNNDGIDWRVPEQPPPVLDPIPPPPSDPAPNPTSTSSERREWM